MATIAGRQGYATLDIVDANQVPLEKHTLQQRPGELWCRAVWGEEFGVHVSNTSGEVVVMRVYIDGTQVAFIACHPGRTRTVMEMCTKTITTGECVRSIYQPFTFAAPDLKESEEEGGGGERPLRQQLMEAVDKLGRVTVEVYDVIVKKEWKTPGQSRGGSGGGGGGRGGRGGGGGAMVEEKQVSFGGPVDEKKASKKGAFVSTTKLGARERVHDDPVRGGGGRGGGGSSSSSYPVKPVATTVYYQGNSLLQKVELRYGHLAQLLLLGVDASKFKVNQRPEDIEMVELDNDEDDDEEQERKKKRVKKEKAEGGAAAAASSSSGGAGAATDTGRVKTEPGGGGGGGDDVWDLT